MIVERLQVLLDANAKQMVAAFGEAGAAADVAALKQGKLTAAQKLWAGAQANMGKIAAAGAVVAGLAITKFALDGTKAFVDLTGQIKQFQRVTGATAQDASRMVGVMHDLGIESEAGTKAMGMFAKNIGAGRIDLNQYGVALAKNANGTVDLTRTLTNLSEKFKNTKDATERAALGQAAFGRGWQTLLPLLLRGKDGIKELTDQLEKAGLVFDQSGVEQGRKAALAMRELDTAVLGLKVQLGRGLTPAISAIANGLRDVLDVVNSLTAPLGGLAGAIDAMIQVGLRVNPITGPFFLVRDAINAVAGAWDDLFSGDTSTVEHVIAQASRWKRGIDDVAGSTHHLTVETQDAYLALLALTGQFLGVNGAALAYNQALDDMRAKQLAAFLAAKDHTKSTAEVAAAQRDAAQAENAAVLSAVGLETQIGKLEQSFAKAKDGGAQFRNAIDQLKQQFPELAPQIDNIIAKVYGIVTAQGQIKPRVAFSVDADVSGAHAGLNAIRDRLRAATASDFRLGVGLAGFGSPPIFHSFDIGGLVPGAKGAPLPAIVHGGETVRTPAQEAALTTKNAGSTVNITLNQTLYPGVDKYEAGRSAVEAVSQYVDRGGPKPSWMN